MKQASHKRMMLTFPAFKVELIRLAVHNIILLNEGMLTEYQRDTLREIDLELTTQLANRKRNLETGRMRL